MKTTILMVCLGNICRSPLAQGILEAKLDASKYSVDSAGTSGYHQGQKPDTRSIAIAKKHGIDISAQRSRKFTLQDFTDFDVIYAMDKSNYNDIIALAKTQEQKQKVKMILPNNNDVPDPYYGANDGFAHVYQLLDKQCDVIAQQFK